MARGGCDEQIVSLYRQREPQARPYFWRTNAGAEADLLMDLGDRQVPFEFKLNSAPDASRLTGLKNCMSDLGIRKGYLVYPGKENYSLGSGIMALAAERLLRGDEAVSSL